MSSLRAFLTGIVDYAGLFPPAKLDMPAAVSAYAGYIDSADRDLLGRFVVPLERLDELSESKAALDHRGAEPWNVSVIAGEDLEKAKETIDRFNGAHGVSLCVDAIETPVDSLKRIEDAVRLFPDPFEVYLEIPSGSDPLPLLRSMTPTSASAKLRTGGITESAIPSPEQVLRFMETCVDEGVPFKATAGLHHAIRGRYPLTYEPDAPIATMHGYLNIFLASAFSAAGSSSSAVLGVIEETDPRAFRVDERGVWWSDHLVVHEQLDVARQTAAVSFGSCSFSEPVGEARLLGLI